MPNPGFTVHGGRLWILLWDLSCTSHWENFSPPASCSCGLCFWSLVGRMLQQDLGTARAEPGFPHGSEGKESACQCRRPGFDPWVRKIPWRREWLPSPVVFLPGEPHEQKSLVECGPWGHRVGHDWMTNTFTFNGRKSNCKSKEILGNVHSAYWEIKKNLWIPHITCILTKPIGCS